MIELVDYNEIYGRGIGETTAAPAKRTRRAGGRKKSTDDTAEKPAQDETATTTATKPAKEKTSAKKEDDLTKIEGIGPKAAEVLIEAGIKSFADVSKSTPENLKEILDNSGGHFNAADPTTWPQQAELAAAEKWDELTELQDKLKGGKEA
ncbi:MAG: DUF4332 domain-containing protein [Ginsengibacter sp.]